MLEPEIGTGRQIQAELKATTHVPLIIKIFNIECVIIIPNWRVYKPCPPFPHGKDCTLVRRSFATNVRIAC